MGTQQRPIVMVAEDEIIASIDLCDLVEETGFEVDGPHNYRETAVAALEERTPDCAILDVRLADGEVFPLARKLSDAKVPIIFYTGRHDPHELVEQFDDASACGKPCPPSALIEMIRCAVSGDHEPIARDASIA